MTGIARRIALLIATVIGSMAGRATAEATRPNIVVILADDMGFSDLGCYGSEIPTPHLDALAAGGLRFTQFYNTARCCPTRASLLTGLYAHQSGVGHMAQDRGVPGYRGRLNEQCVTIAEVLRSAGYFTAMSGKWHVGQNHGVTPRGRGFERSLNAAVGGFYFSQVGRSRLFLDGEQLPDEDARLPRDWYSTDLWTTFGLKFVDEALAADRPFYLHLCYNAPHFPLQAPAEEIGRFQGKYMAGWDTLRAERIERQSRLGLIDPAWQPAPRPNSVKAWAELSVQQQVRFDLIMASYAATVSRMDKAIGDLVEGLKQRGVLENTLILFMSDNGGNAESGPNGKVIGNPSQADSAWFCGESWALLQNAPFRQYKHFNHEGGIASPLIAHWPQRIVAKGEIRHQPSHVIDIMATCVELGVAQYPTEFNGQPIQPAEGRSLMPAFAGPAIEDRTLFWEHEGNAAVRVGDSKLVRLGRDGPWELYDLKPDRTEQHDLSATHPDQVSQLAATWHAWAERTRVIPHPPAGLAQQSGNRPAQARPNVLFIVVDDLNHWIGHFGRNPQAKTPHLDRLAQRGVTFTNAHCAAPVCNPSRTAVLSGMRPGSTGIYDNRQPYVEAVTSDQSLFAQFQNAGYETIGMGKLWHGGLGWPEQWTAVGKRSRLEVAAVHNRSIGGIKFGELDGGDEHVGDTAIADFGVHELEKRHDKPFFLALGFHKPHMPWNVPRKYYEMYPLESIQLPPTTPDDLADIPAAGIELANPRGDHARVLQSGRWKEAVQAYLASIAYLDGQLGRVLDAYDQSPERDQTIICLWSDHGWHLGEKQHWRKFALWEEATRVPLIWVVPGFAPAGGVCTRPVDLTSIYPTLCRLAALPRPDWIEGHDIGPLLANPTADWRHPAIATYGRNNHAIRSERWRYIRYADGGEELYDHSRDPYEWTNLADQPEHATIKGELARYLPALNVPAVVPGDIPQFQGERGGFGN